MSIETPRLFKTPFAGKAETSTINTVPDVPNPNDIAQKPSLAAYSTGFPSRSMQPPQAGGQPFYGQDVNGILNDISANTQYVQAGNYYPFDADFQTAVGGYNKFAVVLNPSDGKLYQSLVDANTAPLSDTKSWFFFTDGNYLPLTGGTITGRLTVESNLNVKKSVTLRETNQYPTTGILMEANTVESDPFAGYVVRRFGDFFEINATTNGVVTKNIASYNSVKDEWNFNTSGLTKNGVPLTSGNDFKYDFTPDSAVANHGNGVIYLPNGIMIQFMYSRAKSKTYKWPVPFTEFVTAVNAGSYASAADTWNISIYYGLEQVEVAQPSIWYEATFIAIGK